MKNEFVPLTEAKLLKQLGFDEPCLAKYQKLSEAANYQFQLLQKERNCNRLDTAISAPLYHQAFRWFREKHNLIFQINYLFNGNYQVEIHKNTHEYMELIQDLRGGCIDELPDNYSYDAAELECLKKLIEIVKENGK